MKRNTQALRRRLERLSARRVQDQQFDLLIVYAEDPDIQTYPMRDDPTYDRVSLFGHIYCDSRCIDSNGGPCEGHWAVIQDCPGGTYDP